MVNNFKRVLLENCTSIRSMSIDLQILNFDFEDKPLLIGGKAKEYYGIRESGADIDFVISLGDFESLSNKYPNNVKEIWGDHGVCFSNFEIWDSICLFDYDFLKEDAIQEKDYLIISFEKLMFLTVLAIDKPKYLNDLYLFRNRIAEINTQLHDYID